LYDIVLNYKANNLILVRIKKKKPSRKETTPQHNAGFDEIKATKL